MTRGKKDEPKKTQKNATNKENRGLEKLSIIWIIC